jgi:hypothetical protein
MELEFPGFVLLLLVAVGLLAFGSGPRFTNPNLERMAAATTPYCVTPDERAHHSGGPAPIVDCGP